MRPAAPNGSTSSPRCRASNDQRHPRQRDAVAGQRRLHLLVGEVEVEPAPRLQVGMALRGRASGASSGTRCSAGRRLPRPGCAAPGRPAVASGGAVPSWICSQRPRLTTGVRVSSNMCTRARRHLRRAEVAQGEVELRVVEVGDARRAPRRGCRCRDARAGTPRSAAAARASRTRRRWSTLTRRPAARAADLPDAARRAWRARARPRAAASARRARSARAACRARRGPRRARPRGP